MIQLIIGLILLGIIFIITRYIRKQNKYEEEVKDIWNYDEINKDLDMKLEIVDKQDQIADKTIKLKEKVKRVETKLND